MSGRLTRVIVSCDASGTARWTAGLADGWCLAVIEFAASRLEVDSPAPIEAWSRLVCQDDGPLVLAALESRAAEGPWVVVDVRTGQVAVGRGLTPVADGRLGPEGDGLLLTYRGLTVIGAAPHPRVHRSHGAGLGTGKDDHEQTLEYLDGEVAVVGRWYRPGAKLVRLQSGEVVRRLNASPPFLSAPGGGGRVRLWALGSGVLLTLDTRTWRTIEQVQTPQALAACSTPHGTVAVLGAVNPTFREGLGQALLRDIAPGSIRRRLRSPYTGLRLALLDETFNEIAVSAADWLWDALPDPDVRGVARLSADGGRRAVLMTADGLTVVDPQGLTRVGQYRSGSWPVPWVGASRAVHQSGERELTVVEWE